MKRVVILDDAFEDLVKARDFYEQKETGLGDYCTISLLGDVSSLGDLHGFHSQRYGFHWMVATRFPYGIYYLVEDRRVVVFAILDQRSRPATIRRLLRKRTE